MDELSFDLQRFAIYNYDNNTRVNGTTSADDIYIYGSNVTANGGTGNDSIYIQSSVSGAIADGGTGNDYINSWGVGKHTLRGGTGNDRIYNSSLGTGAILDGGTGDDTLINIADKAKLTGGTGDDLFQNYGNNVTIDGGTGDDTINNLASSNNTLWGKKTSINGGTGDDVISLSGGATGVTVKGGTGDDIIYGDSTAAALYQYSLGEGDDVVYNLNANDTINITGDNYQRETNGNDVVLTVGTGKISLIGAASKNIKIVGTKGESTASGGGGGNVIITGGSKITNDSNNSRITSGDTNDTIINSGSIVNINAGAGNDTINNSGSKVTINAGAGDDTITLNSSAGENVIDYTSGDGNDLIRGFKEKDSLRIGGGTGTYSTTTSGSNNVVVTVGNGKITLEGAKGKAYKILGKYVGDTINTKPVNIVNTKSNVTLTGTAYADTIANNGGSNVTINAQGGDDSITAYGNKLSVNGGAGNNYVYLYSDTSNVSALTAGGKDSIYSAAQTATINAGAGNNYVMIYTNATKNTVNTGDGNDEIYSGAQIASINAGAGNDYIHLYSQATKTSVRAGAGNDSIQSYATGVIYFYASGDGNDLIRGFKEKDSLYIGDGAGTYSTTTSGSNNVVVTVGNGKITLEGAKDKDYTILGKYVGDTINTKPVNIVNTKSNVTLTGTAYNDTIDNTGSNVKINTGDGNDLVTLRYGLETDSNKVTLDAGNGADTIHAGGKYNSVNAGAGNDSIWAHGSYMTILGGAGNNTISGNHGHNKLYGGADNDLFNITTYWNNTISAGDGTDTIAIEGGQQHSINGGAGADRISLGAATNSTLFYTSGDGNDTVWDFNSTDMLNISGSYSTQKSGSDLRVNVGSSSILIKDATKIGNININNKTITVGEDKSVTQQDVIKNFMTALDKSTASNAKGMLDYAVKTSSNGKFSTLQKAIDAMVEDCKNSTSGNEFLRNYCGIILDNDDTGAISGYDAGGTLKTAKSIVPESGTKFSLDTSQYGGYYVWYDNKNSGAIIRYTDVGTVTKDKQHIMDCAYTWWTSAAMKLIEDSYGYSFNDSNAKYKKIYLTFSQSGDYLAYTGYYSDGLQININLEYFNNFKSNDYDGTSPVGQGYLDRTFAHETVHAIMFSKTKHFHDMPQFFTEGIAELIHGIDDKRTWNINQLANDAAYLKTKLSMSSGTGDSPTYAAGYMLLRYLAKQSATVDNTSFASAVTSTQKKIPTGVTTKDATMTISAKFTGKSINMNDYDSKLLKADASAVTKAINIFGNKNNNIINGGKGADYLAGGAGNDTLSGGAGADILSGGTGNDSLNGGTGNDSLYSGTGTNMLTGGAGKDHFFYEGGKLTITDYEAGEKIKISGDKISKSAVTNGNVVFTTSQGSITLTDAAGKTVTIIDKDDKVTSKVYGKAGGGSSTQGGGSSTSTLMIVTNSTKSPVTIGSAIKTVDATKRTTAVNLTGNALANTISGGSGADSLHGGAGADSILGNAGNDKLWGDAGNDTLRGGAGNDSFAGGAGNDSLWGDAGNDTFFYAEGGGKDVIFGFENNDLLQITGVFSGTYNKSKKEIAFKVGSTANALTLKDFTATSFNINGDSYGISGIKLVKK